MLPHDFRALETGYNAKNQPVALYIDKDNCYWIAVNGRLLIGDFNKDKMYKLFQSVTNP